MLIILYKNPIIASPLQIASHYRIINRPQIHIKTKKVFLYWVQDKKLLKYRNKSSKNLIKRIYKVKDGI